MLPKMIKTDLTVVRRGWGNEYLGRGAILSDGTTILKGRETSGIALRPDGSTSFMRVIGDAIWVNR